LSIIYGFSINLLVLISCNDLTLKL